MATTPFGLSFDELLAQMTGETPAPAAEKTPAAVEDVPAMNPPVEETQAATDAETPAEEIPAATEDAPAMNPPEEETQAANGVPSFDELVAKARQAQMAATESSAEEEKPVEAAVEEQPVNDGNSVEEKAAEQPVEEEKQAEPSINEEQPAEQPAEEKQAEQPAEEKPVEQPVGEEKPAEQPAKTTRRRSKGTKAAAEKQPVEKPVDQTDTFKVSLTDTPVSGMFEQSDLAEFQKAVQAFVKHEVRRAIVGAFTDIAKELNEHV